jgi:hypothetical protein
VVALLVVMVASAAFAWEPWPFTSFRLFSHLRYDEQATWEARAVGPGDEEAAVGFSGAPRGLRGFQFAMAEFVVASAERQDELCLTWTEEAAALLDARVRRLHLYRREWRLSERVGDRAREGSARLVYTCSRRGVRSVG